jgi:hypothetical protein
MLSRHIRLAIFVAVGFGLLLFAAACAPASSTGTSEIVSTVPFAAGEELTYALRDDTGELIGRGVFSVSADAGMLRLDQSYTRADAPGQVVDLISVWADADSLRPVRGLRDTDTRAAGVEGGAVERVEWEYVSEDDDRILVVTRTEDGGDSEERRIRLRDDHYDNESSLWLWRTIAFIEEYDERYVSVDAAGSGQTTVNLRVPMQQAIEVPAGEFDTWRILVRTGRAVRTAWINAEAPHQIVRWDNGVQVFELETAVAE